MTDGWNGRPSQPHWWSDALTDPWRDPYAPAAVVVRPPTDTSVPQPEPVADPDAPRRSITPILLVCVLTALLAGGLGGTLGYLFAVRGGLATGTSTQLGAPSGSQSGAAGRAPDSFAAVAKKVLPSVVTVRVTGAIGSGFVVSADGYVITNDHVVAGAGQTMSVSFSDGTTASARLVGEDTESDVAVIKVARTGLTPVTFGDSDSIAVGDPVLAIGSPLALTDTVTQGIVSALDRTLEADEDNTTRYYAAIQTDAAVNQGNSGGPLVDATGKVIGMNSLIRSVGGTETSAGNIGLAFAIPINQVKRLATDIIDRGKARRTVIGADVVTDDTAATGAQLRTVDSGGPAAKAGLQAGDTVTRIDGHLIEEGTDLIALVRMYAPGEVVTVQYTRGGRTANASVTLAADSN